MVTALEIPDDPSQVAQWMESVIVGPNLGRMVREIEIAQEVAGRAPKPTPPINKILIEYREPILERGLRELPYERIRLLLRYPRSLLALQELVFIEEGEYWTKLPRPAELLQAAASQLIAIQQLFADQGVVGDHPDRYSGTETAQPEKTDVDSNSKPGVGKVAKRNWLFSPVGTIALATAASVSFFFIGNWYGGIKGSGTTGGSQTAMAHSNWGWSRPEILNVSLDRNAYFNHLANLAGEWFNEKPGSAEQLDFRLREFRRSCDRLIANPLSQIPETDRIWLVDKCKNWSIKLEAQISALADSKNLSQSQREADDLINQLMKALRDRSNI